MNPLTPAETEVLKLLACGLSYSQIAQIRGTTWRTAKDQARVVIQKLYVKGCLQAAFYAWRHGIISVSDAWATLQEVGLCR